MEEKLIKLYNTLCQIETKGEGTKLMAVCLNYTSQLINEAHIEAAKEAQATVGGD